MSTLAGLYARALLFSRRENRRDTEFAGLEQTWTQSFSPNHYARYCHLFDEPADGTILPTYFYVLGQKAQLSLLTHRGFPFAVAGLVHLSNHVLIHAPLDRQQNYQLSMRAMADGLTSAGHRLCFESRFEQGGRLIAVNRTLALVRAPDKNKPRRHRAIPEKQFEPTIPLSVLASAGRGYARVSGDYNPIHIHPWLARPFGFRRPIAHGMYSLMRAVHEVKQRESLTPAGIEVSFMRPLFLPAQSMLGYGETRMDDGRKNWAFEVTDKRRGHLQLQGRIF